MFGRNKTNASAPKQLLAVQNGTIINVEQLPDPVFAGKILGDGYAVTPQDGVVVAPADGVVTDVQDTCHAYGIRSNDGLDILVHIGIDTVSMDGEGFHAFVRKGDAVKAGQKLCEVDLQKVKDANHPTETIVLITNNTAQMEVRYGRAKAGETPVLTYHNA